MRENSKKKRIYLVLAGSCQQHEIELEPNTSPEEILYRIDKDADGWYLRSETTRFPSDEDLFPKVEDNETLYAVTEPIFCGASVTELETSVVPAGLPRESKGPDESCGEDET